MKGERGLSLIEGIVAIGILSIVVMSTSTLIAQFTKAQKMVSNRDETNEFMATFSNFLDNKALCKVAMAQNGMPQITTLFQPFTISNFPATNSDVYKAPNVPPPLGNGYRISNQVRINGLDVALKPTTPNFQFAYRSGVTDFYRAILQIRLRTELITNNANQGTQRLPERFFELPVITNGNVVPATVVDCLGTMDMSVSCTSIGGVWNGTSCNTNATNTSRCRNMGNYIQTTNVGACYFAMPAPTSVQNPLTGMTSCPSGSTDIVTDTRSWTNSYHCGKKCTAIVNCSETYHTCLAC